MTPELTPDETHAVLHLVEGLQADYRSELHGIVLYGSKARGDATAESDIDVLVILSDANWQQGHDVSDIATTLSLDHDVLLMPHVVSLAQWQAMAAAPFSFFREVFRDGWPVYGAPEVLAPLARAHETPLADTAATA
ncbi:MAG: nucleotidyltransferase domain-containing protein [Anaerolineales bacterium]|nr:nucleotidyltransferase domain-containing protein [Anaerolineales bacterium]